MRVGLWHLLSSRSNNWNFRSWKFDGRKLVIWWNRCVKRGKSTPSYIWTVTPVIMKESSGLLFKLGNFRRCTAIFRGFWSLNVMNARIILLTLFYREGPQSFEIRFTSGASFLHGFIIIDFRAITKHPYQTTTESNYFVSFFQCWISSRQLSLLKTLGQILFMNGVKKIWLSRIFSNGIDIFIMDWWRLMRPDSGGG